MTHSAPDAVIRDAREQMVVLWSIVAVIVSVAPTWSILAAALLLLHFFLV